MQDGNTSDFIFDVPYLIAFASSVLTLDPGDLILTGTPSGVGYARDPKVPLKPGDVVEVRVEGIATLTNPVVAAE
jgi:acylpyruvate hydrolase